MIAILDKRIWNPTLTKKKKKKKKKNKNTLLKGNYKYIRSVWGVSAMCVYPVARQSCFRHYIIMLHDSL